MKATTIGASLTYVNALIAFLTLVGGPAHAGDLQGGVAAADHGLASHCGATILDQGGNAADAAVATALCAGVVQPAGSGIGGGGFAVWVDPSSSDFDVIDFREVAPAAASRDMFLGPDGAPIPHLSDKGARSVAVPSESRGLADLLRTHGSLSFRKVAAPAIALASKGFTVGAHLADSLARDTAPEVLAEFQVDGHTAKAGDTLRRPALATTLKRWAATRGEDLATGRSADAIVARVAADGGVLTSDDLAAYQVVHREPVVAKFQRYTVITMPAPSSGGIALAQMLRVLDGYDLRAMQWQSPAYLHLLAEVMKHAYADRARRLGDPAFVDIPQDELLSDGRVDAIRAAVDPSHTLDPSAYGSSVTTTEDHGTQHISVLDSSGRAVALTTTINTAFGADLIATGTGVVLNDEMDDFSVAPGVPNAFGLVTGEENAIAAGKRPLSSMTPTVVLDENGRVVLVVGASGGGQIISSTLQVLLNVLVFGVGPERALQAPRIHHQWQPNELVVEPGFPAELRDALTALGHKVVERKLFSAVQVVSVDEEIVDAASDPRKGGRPAFSER
jgi:gamma-glutamyltranspeptidase/glutathione hydrolase